MNARIIRAKMDYRFEAIEPLVAGKDVLDLGAGSGHWRDDWLHGRIREVAKSVLGVDHAEAYVEESRKLGADVIQGDVETLDLGRTFDVVVAGELIEHLSNVGLFLDTCRRHLGSDGILVITTPNVFSLSNLVRRGLQGVPPNTDHSAWYCSDTLRQITERHGFSDVQIVYVRHRTPGRIRRAVLRPVYALIGQRRASSNLLMTAHPTGEPT